MIELRLLLLSNGLTAVSTIDGIYFFRAHKSRVCSCLGGGGYYGLMAVWDMLNLIIAFFNSLDGGVRTRTTLLFVSTYGTLVRQLPCLSFVRVINDVLRLNE
ncbi:hypothetical protein TorRG33x02_241310 [Trema orientale]|uniref:Uncharacterized protein n=1 Tax=Trema orientale TaxID=63057 RepID=A0A2P5DUJ2_TREOI|nr:hypothetical protein TorRG33x02_241310 [Trema orientale]